MERCSRRRLLRALASTLAVPAVGGCVSPGRGPGAGPGTPRNPGVPGAGPHGPGQGSPRDPGRGGRRGPGRGGPQGPGGPADGRGPTGGAGTAAPTGDATGQDGFGGWFADVSNYDGVADRTGREEVTVAVGAAGNGGSFAYEPAAVRVSTGTTVVWEWTGEGGAHDVVAVDGAFESELADEAGATFEHTFESPGRYRYYCTPHRNLGMKGAVVVE